MNKISERYNTKVEVPISIILETIFSDDNHDVETLSRWAKHYNFVDLIEKEGKKYYQLQKDYKKQSFYIWLSKEERKQYEYEDYLLNEIEEKENQLHEQDLKIDSLNDEILRLNHIIEDLKDSIKCATKYIDNHTLFVSGGVIKSILERSDK